MNIPRKEIIKFACFVLLVVGLLYLGHALNLEEKVSIEKVRAGLAGTGPWQYILFFVLYCFAALIPFPTAVLSSASGALWGAYGGTAMTVLSATIASCAPFFIARFMARGLTRNLISRNPVSSRCDRFAGRNGFVAVMIMRLIPIFPWDMVNYLSGLCGIRFRDYFLASLLGTIPASFTYNLIGASMGGPVDKIAVAVVAIASFIIAALYLVLRRRAARQPNQSTNEKGGT